VVVCQGDPLGKPLRAALQAGTIEQVARPNIFTRAGLEAVVALGGQVQLGDEFVNTGSTLRLTPTPDSRGIRLKMVLENVEVLEQAKDGLRLRSDQSRLTRVVKSGELLRLRGGKVSEKDICAEVRVREVP